ncbi:TetR family transcriptional regulator [Pseudonocardia abyssalis]|uniref:TetR family transcriptional regulator n=1 Tax=Pseudonocardia abyssalis TaxID=2792008 RepID=A0ABS6UVN7_9PSEU|nr:TetR family transcriptional regulator [Pseudonocardia abyssalis]MBW0117273.1 TetR family transcriptional regulator [Pseudonocardia abyssalis]MBW0136031.1 TetR family transcriptional regulator [Pseudonocardia abyssalis]
MTGATRRGRSVEGRAEVRRDLVAAAVALFRDRGYEDTTVDDIAAAAGVGRRTFFRYFRSKEDAISPDHETALARIAEVFEAAHPDEPVPSLVLRAGETVFDLYTDDPPLSVARFRLTHDVPVLRDRESASVDHYRRMFTRYLRRRFAGGPDDGDLRAAVIGASVVAAHNLALRAWLADGAPADRLDAYRDRFRRVADLIPGDDGLLDVAERLEIAVGRLERGTA